MGPLGTMLQVIDPANRTGKICIPVEKTHDTLGREELEKNSKKHISLCLLYQQKKCHAGQKCNQIHADRWYIQKLRRAPSKEGTCCPRHGVSATLEGGAVKAVVLKLGGGNNVNVPLDLVTKTALFDRCRKGSLATLSLNSVCRLHQRNCCKFGRNCTNAHICRELGATVPALAALSGRAAAPPTVDAKPADGSSISSTPPDSGSLNSSTKSTKGLLPVPQDSVGCGVVLNGPTMPPGAMVPVPVPQAPSRRVSAASDWTGTTEMTSRRGSLASSGSFMSQRRASTLSLGGPPLPTPEEVLRAAHQIIRSAAPPPVSAPAVARPPSCSPCAPSGDGQPEVQSPTSPLPECRGEDVSNLLAGSLRSFRMAWTAPVVDASPAPALQLQAPVTGFTFLPEVDSDGDATDDDEA